MEISSFLIGAILSFARVSAFLFSIPFLKSRNIPSVSKITMSLGISLATASMMDEIKVNGIYHFIGLIVIQILIGLTLAFVIEMIFSSAKSAGAIFDVDMGFSNTQIFDPTDRHQSTLLANFFFTLYGLVFVSTGGINTMIANIVFSFKFSPTDHFFANADFINALIAIFMYMMSSTMQIALPLTFSMFVLNFGLLFIGKIAPQAGIFMNMMAIKVVVGMYLLFVALPIIGDLFMKMNQDMNDKLLEVMKYVLTR